MTDYKVGRGRVGGRRLKTYVGSFGSGLLEGSTTNHELVGSKQVWVVVVFVHGKTVENLDLHSTYLDPFSRHTRDLHLNLSRSSSEVLGPMSLTLEVHQYPRFTRGKEHYVFGVGCHSPVSSLLVPREVVTRGHVGFLVTVRFSSDKG